MKGDQLALIETSPAEPVPGGPRAWELDDHTREIGRRGLALARDALRHAPRHAA